ncbi:MAG: aspartate-semialdehyde dehydrogenase [Acidobacteria bacterium]|nr:aspartate-semialdehyde dehydrogenase [Acidobacteriota bacterium]
MSYTTSYKVAVLGATGLVGRTLIRMLEERAFPVSELVPLASARSAGASLRFGGQDVTVRVAEPDAFEGVDLVLASAGGSVSRELLPTAAERGAVSIDNTSAFRMDPEVPLVVPEVNAARIADYETTGIIANPNCSTIQLVVVLKPLHDVLKVRRVLVSTYQSISGAGQRAVSEMVDGLKGLGDDGSLPSGADPEAPAFNALPKIGPFGDEGETQEETKMRVETPKILEANISVHATCVRVPVSSSHGEAVWLETERPVTPDVARELLRNAPGVAVVDDPAAGLFPTSTGAAGRDPVQVGRIRRDPTSENGLALWISADNIRKGAALNAIQIAEHLVEHWRVHGHTRPRPALAAT